MSYYFEIAEHFIKIEYHDENISLFNLLPAFRPFVCDAVEDNRLLFSLCVNPDLRVVDKEKRHHIRTFDTGNGDTIVDKLPDGGYQYVIKDINKKSCALVITDKAFRNCSCALNGNVNMQSFGLNNALMLIMAFAGSNCQTVLIHASLVREKDYGYAFIAKSGTGKSTQVSLWLRYIEGCDLMNDDNPIIRMIDGVSYIYGSPWSGKTPCYRKVKARLGAITRIARASENSIERLPVVAAFASVLPSCSSMRWDNDISDSICNIVGEIIASTPVFTLHCKPNQEAALLCHQTISIK
jgi:hypothetical protein